MVRIHLPPAASQRPTRGVWRSSGAFTHGLVRVLGAIVGPQPLLMTAGRGRRARNAAARERSLSVTASFGRKAVLESLKPDQAQSIFDGRRGS
jgi:hypothetical protein